LDGSAGSLDAGATIDAEASLVGAQVGGSDDDVGLFIA
jgi:hypothetical protein